MIAMTDRARADIARLHAEVARLRAALTECAARVEEDRREADKILCHALTMRRHARED